MSPMRNVRRRPLLVFFLALLVLVTGVVAVGAHHDHDATAHHGDCPTCRLADEAAGALPVLAAGTGAILTATPFAVELPAAPNAAAPAYASHRLRAPPQIG